MAFKMKSGNKPAFKFMGSSPDIKEGLDRKYGLGEYSRDGDKFDQRMLPGESKYQYNVRMRKETKKSTVETKTPEWKGKGTEVDWDNFLGNEPASNPDDLTDKSKVQNYGIVPGMSFSEAFAQAGKMGAHKDSPPFEWFNPKSQRIEQFIYELKK
tara:strand:+ start:110 stop:574 length:465 start_codon:yes stop_codon:yes gene_type:complete